MVSKSFPWWRNTVAIWKRICVRLSNGSLMLPNVQIPGIYEYISLPGKRDFEDVIKLWTLRLGEYPRLYT